MKNQAIMETLDAYAKAYCAKDIDALMHVFASGENISLIGTGSDELCAGRDEVKTVFLRNFDEATATRFEWHWSDFIVAGDSAVVAISLTIHLNYQGNDLKVPIRWTVALINEMGRWVWLHRHASSAASSQNEGQAYPKD